VDEAVMVGSGFTVMDAILPELVGTEQPVEAKLIEIFVKLVTPLLARTWVLKDPVPPLMVTGVETLVAVFAPVRL
jgi:hypothetical protein